MTNGYVVYYILNTNNFKMYIGKSKSFVNRKQNHIYQLRCGTHYNKHLQRSFDIHKENSFVFGILEDNISKNDINEKERYYVKKFLAYEIGYNNTIGGDGKSLYLPAIWNGISHETVEDCAAFNGVKPITMYKRLKKGYSCDNDLSFFAETGGKGNKSGGKKKEFEWNGVVYKSKTECAKTLGVHIRTVDLWDKKNYKSNGDIKTKKKRVSYNNICFYSITDLAVFLGLPEASYCYRKRIKFNYIDN